MTFWIVAILLQGEPEPPEVNRARDGVVALRFGHGHGSGFVIDAKGWIITNAHVACTPLPFYVEAVVEKDGASRVCRFERTFLSGVHPTRDLALVRLDLSEHPGTLKALRLSSAPAAGEQKVYGIGFPGRVAGGRQLTVSPGRVLSTNKQAYRRDHLETDAPLSPGNSGGPLCVENGEVVGVVSLGDLETETSLAVPASEIRLSSFVPLRQRPADPAASVELINMGDKCMRLAAEKKSALLLGYAWEYYEHATSWDPGNDELLLKVAAFYGLQGDARSAAAHLTRSLTLNAWPANGSVVYAALADALLRMGKREEAVAVLREGLLKYPDRSALVLEDFAAYLLSARHWVEAAHLSRRALRQNCPHPEEMNRIHQEARGRMSPPEAAEFLDRERTAAEDEARLAEKAATARREGRAGMTPAFTSFLETFSGHQREGGGTPGSAATSIAPDAEAYTVDEVTKLFVQAQLKVSLEHFRAGRFDQAEQGFAEIAEKYPKAPEAADARLHLQVLRERKKK